MLGVVGLCMSVVGFGGALMLQLKEQYVAAPKDNLVYFHRRKG